MTRQSSQPRRKVVEVYNGRTPMTEACTLDAKQARLRLFSIGMLLLGSVVVMDSVWAQGEVPFFARRDFEVGASPRSITVGDFNGDGHQDLATANLNAATVSILLGRGDGTFQSAQDVGVGALPLSITVGDFNGDGHQDLATANRVSFASAPGTVSILLGQGDGTFQAAQDVTVGAIPASITVGDFNGDGHQDLATANNGGNTVSILLGQGDGTFQAAQDVGIGAVAFPLSITVGDFNGDGHQDLVAGGSTVVILLGQGDGTFQAAQDITVGGPVFSVTVSDFNGDGQQDLATGNNAASVSILLGQGDGTFLSPQDLRVGSAPLSVTVGDFNDDGEQDLATANNNVRLCVHPAGPGRWYVPIRPRCDGGRGAFLRHRGGLQWR